jgi:hypothetical protein
VLSGWTVRGGRPQFDVVTGISTGALMATHAFLGSDFDDDLLIYKRISNNDVFVKRPILSILKQTSALDTTPLRQTLMSVITEETLDAVLKRLSMPLLTSIATAVGSSLARLISMRMSLRCGIWA